MAESASDFFNGLSERLDSSKIQGWNSTYQWDLTGDGGGKWYAKFQNGTADVNLGEAENPDITITAAASDWVDIVNGKLNGQMAFLTGKLKIKGDMALAMKLQTLTS
jgi:putative sterol carrier protein